MFGECLVRGNDPMLEPASIVSLSCEDVGQGCKHVTVKRARGRSARIIHSIQPLRSPESRLATCPTSSPPVIPAGQARNDAVELNLKVLDDKLLRAQISEEDKLKVC